MIEGLSYRSVQKGDFEKISSFPKNPEELFFMFPKAEFPFTVSQLASAVESRYDSTVVLYKETIVGFANFYEVEENSHCSIGNVIVSSEYRNKGIGEFLINAMEFIGVEKYSVKEVRLSCFNTNTKGILLYSKLGYKPYAIDKLVIRDVLFPLIKMRKEINTTNL